MAAQIVVAALDQPERMRAGRALAEDRVPGVRILDRDLVRQPALEEMVAGLPKGFSSYATLPDAYHAPLRPPFRGS